MTYAQIVSFIKSELRKVEGKQSDRTYEKSCEAVVKKIASEIRARGV